MGWLRKTFKRRNSKKAYKRLRPKLAYTQQAVYDAVKTLEVPSNMRQVAAHLGWDSGSVSSRLTELRKEGRISIAYRLHGKDGRLRNFYEVAK